MSDPPPSSLESLEVTLDVADVTSEAAFWCDALGYVERHRRGAYAVLADPAGRGPRLVLQQVVPSRRGPMHAHLDLRVLDPDGEVARLRRLGAGVERVVEDDGRCWTVMRDPEGIVFCVCRARSLEES